MAEHCQVSGIAFDDSGKVTECKNEKCWCRTLPKTKETNPEEIKAAQSKDE